MSFPLTIAKEFRLNNYSYLSIRNNGDELTRIIYDQGAVTFSARTEPINTTPHGLLGLLDEITYWATELFSRYHPADKGLFPLCDYKIERKNNGDYKLMGDIGDLRLRATYDANSGDIYQGTLTVDPRPVATVSLHGFLLFLSIYRQFLRLCHHDTQAY